MTEQIIVTREELERMLTAKLTKEESREITKYMVSKIKKFEQKYGNVKIHGR